MKLSLQIQHSRHQNNKFVATSALMANKKVLIITYYWPPSGGAGVQRWLKLSNYLVKLGHEVHVIYPDEKYASYMVLDETLTQEIDSRIFLHPTKSFEPLKWYARLFGKKNIPSAGFANINKKSIIQQLIIFLRTHLFIPDPRKYWGIYAYSAAKKVIKQHQIKNLITSSPPHSVQLIGKRLKKKFSIHWIIDFRDLWTDVYYYELLNHSKFSNYFDRRHERKVIENADHIVTASSVYIPFLNDKSKNTNLDKFTTIPNGYDAIDFEKYQLIENDIFTLTYTGTISDQYNITPFLDALSQFKADNPNNPFCLQFVGSVYPNLKKELTQRNLIGNTKFSPYVPHSESIEFLEKASALLVFGPLNRHGKEGGIPAKVYEYLAARKPIIYVGKKDGFVAEIIHQTASGLAHDNNIVDIQNHITDLYQKWESNNGILPNNAKITEYSRESQAKTFANLLQ